MTNINTADILQTTSEIAADENISAAVTEDIPINSESAISENLTTEVHNNEFSQTEEQPEVSAAEQPESSAVQSVSEEQQAARTETAVPEVSEETGISGTTESVVSDIPDTAMTAKNVQAFLLLAAVFGAVIAAMVLKRKFQKDKRKKTADKSQLTAKERDEIRLAEKKHKKEKKKVVKKKRHVPRTTQKTLPYKCVCDNYLMKVDDATRCCTGNAKSAARMPRNKALLSTSTARHTSLRT